MVRRFVILAVVAFAVGAIGAFALSRGSTDDPFAEAKGSEASLLPAACKFQALVAAGNLVEAKNVFWDEVHANAHILAADLERHDAAAATKLLEKKGAVERDLATLGPALATDTPPFVEAVAAGLDTLDVPGVVATC